ncbi:MAG: PH domain-containing protein [Chloroflexi bacterium]|nr:PH domain-containing protein [Chloroflexota bacterium]
MGYVQSSLGPNERMVYQARRHWLIFFWPAVFILVGFLAWPYIGPWLVPLGIIYGIPAYIEYTTSEFVLTNRRVILKTGWLRRRTYEMHLKKVESVRVKQSITDRIIDAGTVTIRGSGGSWQYYKYISAPIEFRKRIQAQAEE